jgi:hypothetical protein
MGEPTFVTSNERIQTNPMIKPPTWTSDESKAVLGALTNIATLHGTAPADPAESALIDGVRINILHHPELSDADANLLLQASDLAGVITETENRKRASQLIALMPYAVRPYSNAKTYISEKFIEAMGENMHLLEDFIGARQKHSKNMEYCALRKLGPEVYTKADVDGQYKELLELLKDAEGDPAELERYQALKGYPAGSLGKGFWDFYAQFAWPLPGDPRWISEELTVRHDLIHILCSYDISINGEFQVAAFAAGNSEQFNWMIAMLGFTPPYVSTGKQFAPDDFFQAYTRGENATKSLVDNLDFWAEMGRQIDEIRGDYEI